RRWPFIAAVGRQNDPSANQKTTAKIVKIVIHHAFLSSFFSNSLCNHPAPCHVGVKKDGKLRLNHRIEQI
ncbi:MAG: hypothetical protein J6T22_13095, partial [Bacteroidales bacterium]|nr:hypothetical protein [Bacteroidales bacterium]